MMFYPIIISCIYIIVSSILIFRFSQVHKARNNKHNVSVRYLQNEINTNEQQISVRDLYLDTYNLQEYNLKASLYVQSEIAID